MTCVFADARIAQASTFARFKPLRACLVALTLGSIAATTAQAHLDTPQSVPAGCATTQSVTSIPASGICARRHNLALSFEYRTDIPLMNALNDAEVADDITASIPRFRLEPPATRPIWRPAALPPVEAAAEDAETALAPAMIVGAASTYDPTDPTDKDSGDAETASGEYYDPNGWTAAIQIDLRGRFNGVRYRMRYEPTYALVEARNKRVIVRVNDVGPLRPGRIIDLNARTMRFFDPKMQAGVLEGVRVTPLAGRNWFVGPVDDEDGTAPVAQASLAID